MLRSFRRRLAFAIFPEWANTPVPQPYDHSGCGEHEKIVRLGTILLAATGKANLLLALGFEKRKGGVGSPPELPGYRDALILKNDWVALCKRPRSVRPKTFLIFLQAFSDHWPADLAWPSDIPRPAPKKEAA